MKIPTLKFHTALFALLLMVLTTGGVQAQLLFNLTPDLQIGSQNSTVTFSGTLQNTGTDTLYLNSNDYTFSFPNLSLDDTKFFENVPLSLIGGASWSGEIFAVDIGAAAENTYSGSFSILGGTDEVTFNTLASHNFQVTVQGVVPAPSALATMLIGAIPGLVLLVRRRKTIR